MWLNEASDHMIERLRKGPVTASGDDKLSGDSMRQAVRRLRVKGYRIETVSVYVLRGEP